ncbi:MFS transporter [Streptomyces sp. SL13]|uniref:MFS transporter n=1 Tax=Streptantibioticus silvisoli TaxID=2705255 RepID=A0AA90KI91_9ACTN|nr:MFS transporter [Streptantibioticus silvisoli]MDI5961743.1 MFS transporter [Streptantibioticus silvisoli]MDI5972359.1 MFS transporter [Streptantibioticus silvisoli]
MSSRPMSLLRMAPAVFLPALVFETGMGALAPVLALSGRALGASVGTAGLVLALLGVGQILGDVPAGALAARVGDRRAMLMAAAVAVLTLCGCALARNVGELGIAVTATGATNAVFVLARQAYLTEAAPKELRARALSTLGGMSRVGSFVGPFIGAAVLSTHPVHDIYWLAVAFTLAAALVVALVPDVTDPLTGRTAGTAAPAPVRAVVRDHRTVFLTLGVAVLLVGSVRAARQTVLPLWAEHLGFTPATTSVVFGIAGLVDTLTFYPSGQVMDRLGRLWIAVPSMLVLGLTMVSLPLTRTLGELTVVAMVMGFGNGIGSGILMTLGADVAPPASRSQFLGVWRLCADSGSAGGPLVVSAAAGLGSLAAGISTMGVVGVLAAGALLRWAPRYSPFATKGTRSRVVAGDTARPAPSPAPGPDRCDEARRG